MECKRCAQNPGFHSFEYITDISGLQYFYCFPAHNKESVRTREDMLNFVSHFPKDRKWSLLFHMKGYGLQNMMPLSIALELARIVFHDYKDSLQKIYIVEGKWFASFLYLTFPFLGKEIREKIVLLDGSKLSVFAELLKLGLTLHDLERMYTRFG